jgi:hypothetical protein
MTEKFAVGKQIGGFMQHRQRTRPLRVETLLAREDKRSPSEVFQPDKAYERALAREESIEFAPEHRQVDKEASEEIDRRLCESRSDHQEVKKLAEEDAGPYSLASRVLSPFAGDVGAAKASVSPGSLRRFVEKERRLQVLSKLRSEVGRLRKSWES